MKTALTILLVLTSWHLYAQEFWTGTKNPTATIARTGITTIGYTSIRTNTVLHATIFEHTDLTGDLYIRSIISNGSGETGNLIFNDLGGNVGIGTSKPQAKLSVNGNILAKEVKVKTDISVPDYVFEADYKLPTLAETDEYIKKHGHLPDIPSAEEIKRDGLDLAGMNLLLLKKMEELTLHLIAKDGEVKELKDRIDALEKYK